LLGSWVSGRARLKNLRLGFRRWDKAQHFAIASGEAAVYCLRLAREDNAMRVNWAAILVAGIADWLLGAVWFTAFSKQWQAGLRMAPDELQMYLAHPNFWPYLIALLCSCLMAYAIARLVKGSQTHGVFRGIHAGLLVGLAAAVAMITEMVFEYRARPFILISAAYPLVGSLLMGIIVGAWKPKTIALEGEKVKP
jgi:hypothetical protein